MLRIIENSNSITVAFMLCLSFIALAQILKPARFNDYLSLIYSTSFVKNTKNIKFSDSITILTFVIFGLCASIIIVSYNILDFENTPIISILLAFFGVVLLFTLKFGIEFFIIKVFNLGEFGKHYLFKKTNYRNYLGLVFLPFLAFLFYNNLFHTNWATYLFLGIFILYLIKYVIIIRSFLDVILPNWFYFILYLCALEIAPFLIIYKMM